MGVDVVVGGAGDGEYAAVRRLFDTWERVFSRFRPESELNRVVDEAVGLLSGRGFVSAGGDIATLSPVVAELPGRDSIRVLAGGLATSGKTGRYWRRHDAIRHHLIDPRTGKPANSRWDQVTTAAASCLAADVAAKAAFLLSDDGPDWLDERGLPGRFVAADAVVTNRAWRSADRDPASAAAA